MSHLFVIPNVFKPSDHICPLKSSEKHGSGYVLESCPAKARVQTANYNPAETTALMGL